MQYQVVIGFSFYFLALQIEIGYRIVFISCPGWVDKFNAS